MASKMNRISSSVGCRQAGWGGSVAQGRQRPSTGSLGIACTDEWDPESPRPHPPASMDAEKPCHQPARQAPQPGPQPAPTCGRMVMSVEESVVPAIVWSSLAVPEEARQPGSSTGAALAGSAGQGDTGPGAGACFTSRARQARLAASAQQAPCYTTRALCKYIAHQGSMNTTRPSLVLGTIMPTARPRGGARRCGAGCGCCKETRPRPQTREHPQPAARALPAKPEHAAHHCRVSSSRAA